ncbi:MAG: hypothetical protein IJX34_01260 [Clostridia bacterium]|nr:hypothetical protein [Clostridia bacterium]
MTVEKDKLKLFNGIFGLKKICFKIIRCILVYATSIVIKKGLSILGIDCPEKM